MAIAYHDDDGVALALQKVDRRDHGSFERGGAGSAQQCRRRSDRNDVAIDAGGDTATWVCGELADGRQPDAARLGGFHDGRTQWVLTGILR
ncbi:Uncharacterised protein [Mycobacterium tuberculosis]|uniref:Uncharacterized protein n=1 Tax=Mycobacterium tuberculosis TaxID=1773 RepID=A0A655JTH9_MYCTX|nr:Uncharacterised protein [Mycobacterium tuberculosis]